MTSDLDSERTRANRRTVKISAESWDRGETNGCETTENGAESSENEVRKDKRTEFKRRRAGRLKRTQKRSGTE